MDAAWLKSGLGKLRGCLAMKGIKRNSPEVREGKGPLGHRGLGAGGGHSFSSDRPSMEILFFLGPQSPAGIPGVLRDLQRPQSFLEHVPNSGMNSTFASSAPRSLLITDPYVPSYVDRAHVGRGSHHRHLYLCLSLPPVADPSCSEEAHTQSALVLSQMWRSGLQSAMMLGHWSWEPCVRVLSPSIRRFWRTAVYRCVCQARAWCAHLDSATCTVHTPGPSPTLNVTLSWPNFCLYF